MELGLSPEPRAVLDPALPDRAGRGRLCATITQLTKDFGRAIEQGHDDESRRIERRLDQARVQLHAMYGKTIRKGA